MRKDKGMILIVVLVALFVMAIFIPTLIMFQQREQGWTLQEKRKTVAFHMAEQGLDRGVWKLQESQFTWNAATTGSAIAGYNFDVVYASTDSSNYKEGEFKIQFTSGPLASPPQVTITSRGRDKSTNEVRSLMCVVQANTPPQAGVYAGVISGSGGYSLTWGPMESLGSITLSGGANVMYPRKFAVGSISPAPPFNTTGSGALTDASPDDCSGNTGSWWAFNHCPGVPTPPNINTSYYKKAAQNGGVGTDGVQIASGGIYYSGSGDITVSGRIDTTTYVTYCSIPANKKLSFSGGSLIRGFIICEGSVDMSGGPASVKDVNNATHPAGIHNSGNGYMDGSPLDYYPHMVNVPSTAYYDYVKGTVTNPNGPGDSSASNEFPADVGYQKVNPTYTFGSSNTTVTNNQQITFEGFAYMLGNFTGSGGTYIVGAVMAPNDTGGGSGGTNIYYQTGLNIITAGNLTLTREYWREVDAPTW